MTAHPLRDMSVNDLNRRYHQNRLDMVALRKELRNGVTTPSEYAICRGCALEWIDEIRYEALARITERPSAWGSALGKIANGWRNSSIKPDCFA